MQTTMTVRIDEQLLLAAQQYARQQGQSLSQLISEYFAELVRQPQQSQATLPPITQSLVGVLRGANLDEQDYNTYLEEKYL